jgi:cobalt-zinc-cadmium resistance protein CzcA
MLERMIRFAIAHRWLMLVLTLVLIAVGAWSFGKLPIDATPDITNVQVQINTETPGYSPLEAEQRVTFPIESALAGLPRLATRARYRATGCRRSLSCSRMAPISTLHASRWPSAAAGQIATAGQSGTEMGPIATGHGRDLHVHGGGEARCTQGRW